MEEKKKDSAVLEERSFRIKLVRERKRKNKVLLRGEKSCRIKLVKFLGEEEEKLICGRKF